MKTLKRKLRSRAGLTLTELLAAMAVLALLGTAIGAGTSAATRVYRQSTTFSEAAVLASTLTEAIADELRYATDLPKADMKNPSFTSQTYGKDTSITNGTGDDEGRLMIGTHALVGSRTYTSGLTATAEIEWMAADKIFDVQLTITDSSGAEQKIAEFSIAPINA